MLGSIWAVQCCFGALANIANALFMPDDDIEAYVRAEPQRRVWLQLGMLGIGSVHALVSPTWRMEVAVAVWMIGCTIFGNGIMYMRTTHNFSAVTHECLSATVPFVAGMLLMDFVFRGVWRSHVAPVAKAQAGGDA